MRERCVCVRVCVREREGVSEYVRDVAHSYNNRTRSLDNVFIEQYNIGMAQYPIKAKVKLANLFWLAKQMV